MPSVDVVLCAIEPGLVDAWERFCGDLPGVTVHHGSILDVRCDALVSPSNSFGFMDGGIDAAYVGHFGPALERRVRQMILERHGGELLVGSADVVPTEREPRHLIVAPTMRVPMRLAETVNVYLAARAVFRLITSPTADELGIRTVALPGLGTGVGHVDPSTCASQVAAAYRDFVLGEFEPPVTWVDASHQHQALFTDTPRRLE